MAPKTKASAAQKSNAARKARQEAADAPQEVVGVPPPRPRAVQEILNDEAKMLDTEYYKKTRSLNANSFQEDREWARKHGKDYIELKHGQEVHS